MFNTFFSILLSKSIIISNVQVLWNTDEDCDVCDKISETKSSSKRPEILTHNDFEKCIKTKHIIQNSEFCDINEIFTDYITKNNKKIQLYLVKYGFKLIYGKKNFLNIVYLY